MTTKPWFSKTILLNVFFGVVTALLPIVPGAAAAADFVKANLALIGAAWAILGVVVRLVTKNAISLVD